MVDNTNWKCEKESKWMDEYIVPGAVVLVARVAEADDEPGSVLHLSMLRGIGDRSEDTAPPRRRSLGEM